MQIDENTGHFTLNEDELELRDEYRHAMKAIRAKMAPRSPRNEWTGRVDHKDSVSREFDIKFCEE